MRTRAFLRSFGLSLGFWALLASGAQAQLQILDKNDMVLGPVVEWLNGVSPVFIFEDGNRKVPLSVEKNRFQTSVAAYFTNSHCGGAPWVLVGAIEDGVHGMQNRTYTMKNTKRLYRTGAANPVKTRMLTSFFDNGSCSVIGFPFTTQVIRADRLVVDLSTLYKAPFRVE